MAEIILLDKLEGEISPLSLDEKGLLKGGFGEIIGGAGPRGINDCTNTNCSTSNTCSNFNCGCANCCPTTTQAE